MPTVLLKPYILSYKNRLFAKTGRGPFHRETGILLVSVFLMFVVYGSTDAFIRQICNHPSYSPELLTRLLHLALFSFFILLIFSNTIVSLGSLYTSFDLPLLLTLPISRFSLYTTKLVEVMITSSWMFFLFGLPAGLA